MGDRQSASTCGKTAPARGRTLLAPRAHPRTSSHHHRMPWVCLLLLSGILPAVLAGCRGVGIRQASPVTHSDRLMGSYADLQSGRFVVIADFEQTSHMELFRSVSSGGAALHRLSLTSGIPSTGGRCLHATFGRPDDELIADATNARQWNLPRDWREYDLLLMSVHVPDAAPLQLSIVSGKGRLRSITDSRIPLKAGWNVLRLDLADAAEHVALDDIRELRWLLPELTHPTVLLLDDIVLANNRADLFGDSGAENGGLYVRRRGRRWDIGAGGHFEIGFINGQIRHWYDLSEHRLAVRNLVEDAVLGPSVVTLTGDDYSGGAALDSFPAWGDRVVARQRLVEASPTRIVVACDWSFVPSDTVATTDVPRQNWTYTVYPSGELYVHVECTTETATWAADRLGLAVSRRDSPGMDAVCHSTSQLGDTGRLLHVPYAYVCGGDAWGPDLLFVVHNGRSAPVMKCVRAVPSSRFTAMAFGGETQKPIHRWSCLLGLGSSTDEGQRAGAARAVRYCFPPALSPSVGTLVTDTEGDNDHDGFNERFGCYTLAPDENRVLLALDAQHTPLHNPTFVIQDSFNTEAWVYVDYVILETISRTAAGDVLFQIPGVVDAGRVIEVYLRNPTR